MEATMLERGSLMYLEFGNDKAIEGYRDPRSDDPEKVRHRPAPGQRITQVAFPEDTPLLEAFQSVVKLIDYHVTQGEKPAWVDSDSAGLEKLLKEHLGIKASRPKQWGDDTGANHLPRMADLMGRAGAALLATTMLGRLVLLHRAFSLELRTNAGRDFQANVMGYGGAGGAGTGAMRPADYLGITSDNTAPDATRTTLPSEVSSGSLTRAQAIYAHTSGTASYTLTKTFTSDQPINVAKLGVFNAPSGGTMVFETLLNSPAPMQSGDQLALTETVTL
jgi:hypothetical protein